jgi:hypothetical protein
MPRSASVLVLLLCGCAIDSGFKRFNDAPTAAISAPGNGDTFRQGAGILVVTLTAPMTEPGTPGTTNDPC